MRAPWEDPRIEAGMVRQMAERRNMLAAGARHVGWKVGFGSPQAMEAMGTTAPLVGFLTSRTVLADGATVDVSDWTRPVVEFEVAVWIGSPVPPGATPEQAWEAVSAVGPAIELADIDLPLEAGRVEDILARDIFHAGVVLGEPGPGGQQPAAAGLEASVMIDGREHARTDDLQALTGRYDEVVAVVAGTLASVGEQLRPGDVIITGSVVTPVPAHQGREFRFRLGDFPEVTLFVEGSTGAPTG
ncbi:MAG: 2-oxo-hepta-3-ene-1,7-dioic acid hydratase [Acidimicrobiia bacterium]|nr:MAG: 2-oxo-hepta-3-ene-1,7-dioic acid hydratase [Acidimicrobiia bacterium]